MTSPLEPQARPQAAALATELAAAKAEIARLSEKLEVLQSFTRSGFFEREFPGMGGRWDRRRQRPGARLRKHAGAGGLDGAGPVAAARH
jgi:hypothetical protein